MNHAAHQSAPLGSPLRQAQWVDAFVSAYGRHDGLSRLSEVTVLALERYATMGNMDPVEAALAEALEAPPRESAS